jgi:hypothetical protein
MSHHSDDGMLIAGTVPVLEVTVLHSRSTNESWNEYDFHFLENVGTQKFLKYGTIRCFVDPGPHQIER